MPRNILSPLERNGQCRRRRRRKRRWWIGPNRKSGGLQSRMNSQLHQDALYVCSRLLERDRQQGGDLLHGEPAHEKLEHQPPSVACGALRSVAPPVPPPWPCTKHALRYTWLEGSAGSPVVVGSRMRPADRVTPSTSRPAPSAASDPLRSRSQSGSALLAGFILGVAMPTS